jgi:hypothetical protein
MTRTCCRFFELANAGWIATGVLIDIRAIGEQFGLVFWHDETGGISHNLRTLIVDARGPVQKLIERNKWASDELVAGMLKAAAVARR